MVKQYFDDQDDAIDEKMYEEYCQRKRERQRHRAKFYRERHGETPPDFEWD